jgi:hypothetical protein
MLVNYRYGRTEDDFTGNILTVITPIKAHNPRPTTLAVDAIKEACTYMLHVLDGERVRANLFLDLVVTNQHVVSTWVTESIAI